MTTSIPVTSLLASALFGLLLTPSAFAQQTYTTADTSIAIPDADASLTACQIIVVADATTISDLDIAVGINHTYIGDVHVRLESPGGSQLSVLNQPGRSGGAIVGNRSNLASSTPISYDDAAPSGLSAETAGDCGQGAIVGAGCGPDNYIPAPDPADTPSTGVGTNLAQYNGGSAAGTWTLCAADGFSSDTGTLVTWSLLVNGGAPEADLSITKTDGAATEIPGTSVTYTILASNAGPDPVTGANVSDTFPGVLSACGWTCVAAGGASCTANGSGNIADSVDLPMSGSATYTATCSIAPGALGSLANTATVTGPAGVIELVSANNSATDTNTLTPTADVGISKTDGVTSAVPGQSVVYTLVASNAGPSNDPAVSVTDSFPAVLDCAWTSVNAGGATGNSSGSGMLLDSLNMPVGSSVTYTATCGIDPGATGTLSNTANISGSVVDPNSANDSAADTDTVLTPQAQLSITKDDGVTSATPGQSVVYSIVASNAGPSDALNSAVSDNFPAACSSVSWSCLGSNGATCSASSSGDIVDTVDLPVTGFVTYTATCNIDSAASGSLDNTASVAPPAGVADPNAGDNSATDSDTLTPEADLAISKDDGVTSAVPGQSVTYSIVASNPVGPSATDATVSDTFPGSCSSVSWTCSGAAGGTCAATGSGDITDAASLPVGASVTYIAICDIDSAAAGTLDNTASIAAAVGTTDPNAGNDSAIDSDTLDAQVDLVVSKDDGVTTAVPGQAVTYVINVSNAGPSAAPGSSVTDTFPAACTSVAWTCSGAGGGTCTAAGSGDLADTVNLPAGASVSYSAVCNISLAATGSLANTASAAPAAGISETNPADNSATDTDSLVPDSDLAISKDDGVSSATPGLSVSYQIIASNAAGPSNTVGASVTDNFPTACSTVSWICVGAGGGTCAASGSGNIADTIDLPVGATATYSATCAIDSSATGSLVNTASIAVASGATDPNPANNSATDTDTLIADSDLSISKDDGVTTAVPGQSVTYSIGASNAGPSAALAALVSDSFPAICTSVSWTCSAAGGAACAASGSGDIAELVDLPVGATASFSAICSIDAAATGNLVNSATVAVAAGSTDPNAANNSATDTDTLTPQADLAIAKTDGLTTVHVGGTGTYVITTSNAGPSDAPGSNVTDIFPANATPGAWTCVASGGGVCPASGSGNISASVDLPVGASAVFSVAASYANTIGIASNTATVASAASVTDPSSANNSATDSTEIVSPATLSATKIGIANMTVSGGSLNYVIEISNSGPQNQLDNPGPEMVDLLPFGYVYLSASASSGTLSFAAATRSLEWSGPIAVGQVIAISINGSIDPAVAGTAISNQAQLNFDADGNGSNEAGALSDDPSQPGNADATVIGIAEAVQVPALQHFGLLLLALLFATLGLIGLRIRS